MDEGFKRKVKAFLAGTLDRKQTLEVLDQVKKSEVCRRYLEEQASVAASARRAQGFAPSSDRHSCRPMDEAPKTAPSSSKSDTDDDDGNWSALIESPRRRGLRRTILLGFVVLIFIAVSSQLLKKGDDDGGGDRETRLVLEALAEGLPIVISPAGETTVRPMAISGILPPGNRSVRLTILGRDQVAFEREYRATDASAEFDELKIGSGEAARRAVEVLLPFPSSDELALASGARYFIVFELPNGSSSTPLRFAFRKD